MFSHFSQVKAKGRKFLFAALVLVLLIAIFGGCSTDPDDDEIPSLHGTWKSSYNEVYIIDLNLKTFESPSYDWPNSAYKGNILEIQEFNSASGIIFINLTNKGESFGTSGSGDITGVHYSNLTVNTVSISAASGSDYKTPCRSTLAAAKLLLNADSLGTYFGISSPCIKQ